MAALDRLPGRKFVFTNADEGYARRVLDRLGLANAFDGMHDIHAMDYVPKPHPAAYAAICARHGIDPARALFVDDMARNLAPAKALGMTTVWLDNGSERGGHDADPATIDFVAAEIGRLAGRDTGRRSGMTDALRQTIDDGLGRSRRDRRGDGRRGARRGRRGDPPRSMPARRGSPRRGRTAGTSISG